MKRWPIVVVVTAAATICIGALFYNVYNSTPLNESADMSQMSLRDVAIREARDYTPPEDTACSQVLTPAIHDESGATFTFATSCLAPGWTYDGSEQSEAVRSELTTPEEIDTPRETATMPEDPPATEASPSDDIVDESTRRRAVDTEERILDEARKYKPRSIHHCKDTKTSATHSKTGIRYSFPTNCIPSGWEYDKDRFERTKLYRLRY